MDQPEAVIALYRPKPGGDDALRALVARHVAVLREQGLVTDRPVTWLRSTQDGTWLEIFEWRSGEAAQQAHENASVQAIWGAMQEVAEFISLSALAEADRPFPHFLAVDHVMP